MRLKILIFDDERKGVQHLHNALVSSHDVAWSRSVHEAMNKIDEETFDVIICGTHLINESIFEFLKGVRDKASSKEIPFVCFRSGRSEYAKSVDSQIEYTTGLLGATSYIVVNDETDPEHLRSEVENALSKIVNPDRPA